MLQMDVFVVMIAQFFQGMIWRHHNNTQQYSMCNLHTKYVASFWTYWVSKSFSALFFLFVEIKTNYFSEKNENKKKIAMKKEKWWTSWSMFAAVAGVLGAGDIGSGVCAPLDWLSIRRLARDRVLYGNFKKVVNFFRSSANARSWRCAYASLLMSSSDDAITAGASVKFASASADFSVFGSCNW